MIIPDWEPSEKTSHIDAPIGIFNAVILALALYGGIGWIVVLLRS